jgi:type IV secretion system protein VirD4
MTRFTVLSTRVPAQPGSAHAVCRARDLSCARGPGPHPVFPPARALGLPVHAGAADAARLFAMILACAVVVFAAQAWFRRVRYGRRRPWLSLPVRVRLRLMPGPGFASGWVLWRRHGLPAARRTARHARPSLTWPDRRSGNWRAYAGFAGWAQGWIFPRRVYSTLEQLRLVIAAPQQGKSAAAAGTILDAPGAVVATSIRGDLIAATAGLRSRTGRVHVWNPEAAGEFGSTMRWNPAAGCQDMVTAVRRAGYMVEAMTSRGLSDESFWSDQASMTLAAYLHAAGLAGGDLRHVYRWVTENDSRPAKILRAHPRAEKTALSHVVHYQGLPERTRAGVSTTLLSVLKFMQHPHVVASLCPRPGEGFDFEAFATSRDTLYLVAADARTSPVPPLFVAILAEIAHTARHLGAIPRPARPPRRPVLGSAGLAARLDRLFPAGTAARLDPPLTMILDEVANTAPVPAAAWATWAAGSGIWLHLYAQAFAQLAERWGDHGARVLWQACQAKIIYAGTSEPELCQLVEDLCGYVKVRGPDEHHYTYRGELRRRPASADIRVLPMAAIRQLPPGRAVVIAGTAPPVIVRAEQYWRRADYRAWRRSGHRPDLPEPAARPPGRPVPRPVPAQSPPRWPHLHGDQHGDSPSPARAARSPGRAGTVPGAASRTADAVRRPRPGPAPWPQRPARPAPWDQAAPGAGADDQP